MKIVSASFVTFLAVFGLTSAAHADTKTLTNGQVTALVNSAYDVENKLNTAAGD